MSKSEVSFDSGHADMVHDVQMDFYGKRMATASSDRTVKIFELTADSQALVADLAGHEGPVWQVSWAHPKFGTLLASCGFDHKVIVWQEQDGVWSQVGSLIPAHLPKKSNPPRCPGEATPKSRTI